MLTYLKLLFQLILSPEHGWKDAAEADEPVRSLLARGFYPLLLVTAASGLLEGLYHPAATEWHALFQRMAVEFVKFFVSYYIAGYLFTSYIHRFTDAEPSEQRNHSYILFGLSLLALMNLLQNCIPIDLPIIGFLAIYVAIVLLRGTAYMHIDEPRTGKFMVFSVCSIIVLPYLLGWLLSRMIG